MAASDYTRKVQGSKLFITRDGGSPIEVGGIRNFQGLSAPVNDIDIGSWEDEELQTRAGRRKTGDATYDLYFNPDEEVQQVLNELEGTDEIITVALVAPEGTINTRTFTAMVSMFGEDGQDDGVIMGHVTLAVLTKAVRT